MRTYATGTVCLEVLLRKALDDEVADGEPCGRCSACIGVPVGELPDRPTAESVRAAGAWLAAIGASACLTQSQGESDTEEETPCREAASFKRSMSSDLGPLEPQQHWATPMPPRDATADCDESRLTTRPTHDDSGTQPPQRQAANATGVLL